MNDALNPPSLAAAVNAKGFSGAAGFRIVSIEPGRAELALARRDDLVQFFGHFHGGVITALADQAAGIAVTSGLPKGRIGGYRRDQGEFSRPCKWQRACGACQNAANVGLDRRRHRRNLQ
jgi:acyl-coenzyme A thioesterase PaaI-like protein